MPEIIRSGRRAASLATSIALLVAAAAGIGAATAFQTPSAARQVPIPSAAIPVGDTTGVCPAPARLLAGANAGTDSQFSPVSKTAKSAIRAVALAGDGGTLPRTELTGFGSEKSTIVAPGSEDDDAASATASSFAGAAVLTAIPAGDEPAAASALRTYTATDGDLAGLAAAGCAAPSNDAWLVGASTTLGHTAVLNLHNASQKPATVDLGLYGDSGPIEAYGSQGILVAPGETESVVLAGMAPNQDRLSVHVTSTGGPVGAIIQQSILRELTPGGVAYITASAQPATSQVVTGVRISDPKRSKKIRTQDGYADAVPALEVAVPGSRDAAVEVQVLGPDGPVDLPDGGSVTAEAGATTRIPLTGLPAGTYTVRADADVPVVAGARVIRAEKRGKPVDIAFAGSAERIGAAHVVAIADTGRPRLVFGGDGAVDITPIRRNGGLGKTRTVTVKAGHTRTVTARSLGSKVVGAVVEGADGTVYGAQVLTTKSRPGIAVAALPPALESARSMPIELGF